MINDFLEFIKRMGIFLICAESILYFSPGNSYQKYIRVLIGFMLLMQFMIPVKAFLSGQDRVLIENQVNEFRLQIESMSNEGRDEFLNFPNREEIVEQSIIEEVKTRLNNVLKQENLDFLVIDVELGKITRVIIMPDATESKRENNDIIKININNISIEKIDINGSKEPHNTAQTEELLNLFCRELGTGREYLEVMIVD